MDNSRVKLISEVETNQEPLSVKSPFKVREDKKRRYIRLEISEPINHTLVKDASGKFLSDLDAPSYEGSILNLSAGGVLILCDSPIEEGSIVLMNMTLQGVELLHKVLGLVKRAEGNEEDWLLGVEFISKESLADYLSQAEIDLLPEDASSFSEKVRTVLNKYVYSQRVADGSGD